MAGITAGVAAVCLTNTKACFGSCPTFYIEGSTQLAAEGFSASIAPALEATDLDMLARARPRGRDFTLRLTNEALETHVIRWADVIVAPRPSGGRVFVTPDGRFLNATALTAPSRCTAAEGDCLAAVARLDGQERSTTADSTDLATRETIELEAVVPDSGDWGVVMTARQSLLTTFLIYQSLAYMGQDAGRFLAALGTMGPSARAQAAGLGRTLGRIDVLVPDDSGWIVAGSVGETGPLAADTKIVPLPMRRGGAQAQKIRLRMTKGLWRIDYVALARLGKPVATQRLQPARVRRDGRDDPAAWRALRDSALVLATLPGDVYQLTYRLPPHPERYEIFLEARGYYLEWMRERTWPVPASARVVCRAKLGARARPIPRSRGVAAASGARVQAGRTRYRASLLEQSLCQAVARCRPHGSAHYSRWRARPIPRRRAFSRPGCRRRRWRMVGGSSSWSIPRTVVSSNVSRASCWR